MSVSAKDLLRRLAPMDQDADVRSMAPFEAVDVAKVMLLGTELASAKAVLPSWDKRFGKAGASVARYALQHPMEARARMGLAISVVWQTFYELMPLHVYGLAPLLSVDELHGQAVLLATQCLRYEGWHGPASVSRADAGLLALITAASEMDTAATWWATPTLCALRDSVGLYEGTSMISAALRMTQCCLPSEKAVICCKKRGISASSKREREDDDENPVYWMTASAQEFATCTLSLAAAPKWETADILVDTGFGFFDTFEPENTTWLVLACMCSGGRNGIIQIPDRRTTMGECRFFMAASRLLIYLASTGQFYAVPPRVTLETHGARIRDQLRGACEVTGSLRSGFANLSTALDVSPKKRAEWFTLSSGSAVPVRPLLSSTRIDGLTAQYSSKRCKS